MQWLRRFFGRNAPSGQKNDDVRTFSHAEATEIARRDAKRDLVITPHLISYVAFAEIFQDLGRFEFRFDNSGRGTLGVRLLPMSERQADEAVTDEQIKQLAQNSPIHAIRLYRLKYASGLAEAKQAISQMIANS